MLEQLTKREQEIARLVATGLSNKGIANALKCHEGTIRVHMGNIFRKLKIEKRTALAVIVVTNAMEAT